MVMQRELDFCGLELAPDSRHQVEQLVSHGVDRMKRSHALDHPGLMINAEQNLKSLVRYFASQAREMGTFPRLGSEDFNAAMRACPTYWPYWSSG